MSRNPYYAVRVELTELSAPASNYFLSMKLGGRLIIKTTAAGDGARARKAIVPSKGVFMLQPDHGELRVTIQASLFAGLVQPGEPLTIFIGVQDASIAGSPSISHIANLHGDPEKWNGRHTLRAECVTAKNDPAYIDLQVEIVANATHETPTTDRGEHVNHKLQYKEFRRQLYGHPLPPDELRALADSLMDEGQQRDSVQTPNETILRHGTQAAFLHVDGKLQELKEARNPVPKGSFGYASHAFTVEDLGQPGFVDLLIPLSNTKELQRDKIHVFRWVEEAETWAMQQFSCAHPKMDVAWARISAPGIYIAVGLTLNPYKRETIQLIAQYKTLITGARAMGNEQWINNLCKFILCGPDMMDGMIVDDGLGGFTFPDLPADPEQAREQLHQIKENLLPETLGFPRPGMDNICEDCYNIPFIERIPELEIIRPSFQPYRPLIPGTIQTIVPNQHWTNLGPTFPSCVIRDIAIHPADSNTIYAAANNGGVWRTTNGGDSWHPMTDKLPNLNVTAIAISRTAPRKGNFRTIYFGTKAHELGDNFDIYASHDNGLNWQACTAIPSKEAWEIATGRNNAQLLYLAGDTSLHKSLDGGSSWIVQNVLVDGVNKANVHGIFDGVVWDIKLDPTSDSRLYIAVEGKGILRSDDGGASFTTISNGLAGFQGGARILLDVGNDARPGKHGTSFIVAKADLGIAYSTNRGGAWTTHPAGVELGGSTQSGWSSALAICPSNQDYIVAGGFWASQTGNATNPAPTWAVVPGGYWAPWDCPERMDEYHPDIQAIRFDPNDHSRYYICTDGGITRVDNNGTTVLRISDGINANVLFHIDISQNGTFHVGASSYHVGILRKIPGSSAWKYVEVAEGGLYRIDPRDPTLHFCNPWGSSLKRSASSGDQGSWTGLTIDVGGAGEAYVHHLEFRPAGANVIWCATFHDRIHHSTDRGQTWIPLANAKGDHLLLDGTGNRLSGAACFAFAPSDANILYLGTGGGRIWRTLSGALNSEGWEQTPTLPLAAGTAQVNAIAIHPSDPQNIIVGYGRSGANQLFRTTDAGSTWNPLVGSGAGTLGRLPQLPVIGIVIDPTNPLHIVVALQFGVYVTYDGGAWWQSFNLGLPSVAISEMRYRRATRKLYIATGGRGAYQRNL